jgi:CRP/FNR family transcriptional regulator, cyclic AMP receptor protein
MLLPELSSSFVPAAPEVLRKVGLFAGLDDDEIKRLADVLKESTFSEGTVILTEGKGGIAFFVIGDGSVEYSVNGERVGSGGAGDYFGEVALIDDRPRSATVTAATDVTVYGMTFWEFQALVEEHPDIASELRRVMAERQRGES